MIRAKFLPCPRCFEGLLEVQGHIAVCDARGCSLVLALSRLP